MSEYKEYRKKGTQLLRPYVDGEDISKISISISDENELGCPKVGDMIGLSKDNPNDLWLVSKEFFEKNYELAE